MTARNLIIFDTTLRDGEQAPGFSMRIDEKLKLARQIARLGADVIEAGFPIASEADAEAVRVVSTNIRGPIIAALARCSPADIEKAAWALAPAERSRIHVFIATSDLHLERKLRMSRADCLRAAMQAVALARTYTDDVQFSAEDATRSDPEFLWRVIEGVIQSGARTRWRRSRAARGRWSAPSTASASGPEMRRSKKSSWLRGCAPTCSRSTAASTRARSLRPVSSSPR
jgi:2-isopropylmalate synthase